MLKNEIKLKESILNNLQKIILLKDPDYKVFNESKLFLQLWVFSPYIKDSLIDDLAEKFKAILESMFKS